MAMRWPWSKKNPLLTQLNSILPEHFEAKQANLSGQDDVSGGGWLRAARQFLEARVGRKGIVR